jgi:hypothetical protein
LTSDPEGHDRKLGVIDQVFAYAAIEKMRQAFAAMGAHTYELGIDLH